MSLRAAWAAQTSRRASFLIKLAMMVINDVTWVIFWLLVFSHKHSIRGWQVRDVMVLFAVLTVVGELVLPLGIGLVSASIVMSYADRRAGTPAR